MKKGNAEIYYKMNFMMLIVISLLFLGGILSTYTGYKKYGLHYDVITIINGMEVIESRSTLLNSIYVLLFGLFTVVSLMNCQVYHAIRKYLGDEESEQ